MAKTKDLPIAEQNCGNCMFLRPAAVGDYTVCRRSPPQVDVVGRAEVFNKETYGQLGLAEGIWPVITSPETKWCGEWRTK